MGEGSKAMDVFTIIEREGMEKPFWRKLGKAFTNRDGSINVYLDAVPTNGKLQLREPWEDKDGVGGTKSWMNEGARREPAALEG